MGGGRSICVKYQVSQIQPQGFTSGEIFIMDQNLKVKPDLPPSLHQILGQQATGDQICLAN